MVDITRVDKITKTARAAQKDVYYSDFYTNFNKHPESNFLVRSTNEESVKRALRNLLLTNKGERLYQPDRGADIDKFLFEDISAVTASLIKNHIVEAIKYNEPRVRVLDVAVVPNEINNSYEVGIIVDIINNVNPVSLSLTLYRVR